MHITNIKIENLSLQILQMLKQWFFTGHYFNPHPKDIWQCLETVFIITVGELGGCYWHAVDRDQGHC